jgi:hypothetical protein
MRGLASGWSVVALAAVGIVSGCERSPTMTRPGGMVEAAEVRRLLVAEHDKPRLHLIELGSGSVRESFDDVGSERRSVSLGHHSTMIDQGSGRLFTGRHGLVCLSPLICAVHCVAAPLLVGVAPGLAPTPTAEWILLAVAVSIAAPVLVRGVSRTRELLALLTGAVGVLIWLLSVLGTLDPAPEEVTTTLGSLLLAASLVMRMRQRAGTRITHSSARPARHPAAGHPGQDI